MGRSVASPCVGVVLLAGIFELLKHGVYSEFFPLHDGSMKSKQENPNLRCDPVAIASFFFFSAAGEGLTKAARPVVAPSRTWSGPDAQHPAQA